MKHCTLACVDELDICTRKVIHASVIVTCRWLLLCVIVSVLLCVRVYMYESVKTVSLYAAHCCVYLCECVSLWACYVHVSQHMCVCSCECVLAVTQACVIKSRKSLIGSGNVCIILRRHCNYKNMYGSDSRNQWQRNWDLTGQWRACFDDRIRRPQYSLSGE